MTAPNTAEKTPSPLMRRVGPLVARVQQVKAVRVFVHYSELRGPILASGLAFQGLFAVFAGLWVAFSAAGIVISGNEQAQNAIIGVLNNAIPGLIDTGSGAHGAIDAKLLLSAGVFGVTGAIALVGVLLTALSWMSAARDSVRTMFDIPTPAGNFAVLKLRDLGLGIALGVALIVSAVASIAGTSATGFVLGLVGIHLESTAATAVSRIVTLAVMFALDTLVLATLYRVLSAVRIPRRRLWAGALLGAIGLGILKTAGSALLGGATNNPLIASFAVLAGLLVFFNFVCQVILLAASWIAVGLLDAGIVVDPRVAQMRLENARRLIAANEPEPDDEPGALRRLFGVGGGRRARGRSRRRGAGR